MPVISLTTDFGNEDGYVGTMKGVIHSIAPEARIVDITHDVDPQDLRQAAYILSTAIPYFPDSAIHVVVVDPGVGSDRRPIVLRSDVGTFVAPDNGVLSPFLDAPDVRILHADQPQYWLPVISRTFHGRDIFSPLGAHLAASVPFEALGSPITDVVTFDLYQSQRLADGSIRGQVLHSDRFGNLITDIPMSWLEANGPWLFEIAGRSIDGLTATYAVVERGTLIALAGSDGLLEIAVREGNAGRVLDAGPGAEVIVKPPPSP
jgi:S-adenosylmethionine hydrolase